MRLLNLYLETSIFGFYYDLKKENVIKKNCTITLFSQILDKRFNAYYSFVTAAELQKTINRNLRTKMFDLMEYYNINELIIKDNLVKETEIITSALVKSGIIPKEKKDDALHFAIAALYPEIDYLVTWNCKHIANEITFRKVKSTLLSLGYEIKFDVTTPEEVIYYEK